MPSDASCPPCPLRDRADRERLNSFRQAVDKDDLDAFGRLCASTPWTGDPDPDLWEILARASENWACKGKLRHLLDDAQWSRQAQKNVGDWALSLAVHAGAEGLALRALEMSGRGDLRGVMLDKAISMGWEDLPKALWEKGAPTTPQGMTEAMGAAVFGWEPSWRDWVARCDPLARDERGWTAAHFAAYHGNAAGLSALMARGGLEAKNDGGRTPLEEAARGAQTRCVELLADAGLFDPDSRPWKAAEEWGRALREKQGDRSVAIALESRALAWRERQALAKHVHASSHRARKFGL